MGYNKGLLKKVMGGGLSYRCRWDLTILGFELLGLRLGDEFPPLLDSFYTKGEIISSSFFGYSLLFLLC